MNCDMLFYGNDIRRPWASAVLMKYRTETRFSAGFAALSGNVYRATRPSFQRA